MADKLLTVSVAAYNAEKTIRQALDSLVVPEILDKLEVFVIDDGGTDSTLEIVREYEKKYPGTFCAVHKENGGYGSTVNYSIAHATGKYFKLLDGDDWFDSKSLAELVKKLNTLDVDLIITHRINFRSRSGKMEKHEYIQNLEEGIYPIEELNFSKQIGMHAITYNTKILRSANPHLPEHSLYTDTIYACLPITHVKTVYVLKCPLYIYRTDVSGQSISISAMQKHHDEQDRIFWETAAIYHHTDPANAAASRIIGDVLAGLTGINLKMMLLLDRNRDAAQKVRSFCERMKMELPEIVQSAKHRSKWARLVFTFPYEFYPIWNWLCIRWETIKRGGD